MNTLILRAGAATMVLISACSSGQGGPAAKAPDEPAAPPAAAKEPAAPPASPIDAALPSMVPPNLPQRSLCKVGTCFLPHLIPEDLRGNVPDKGALFIWEEMIGAKARLVVPPDSGVDLAGVVLEGSVGMVTKESQWGSPKPMTQWQGFHAPGAGVTLSATSGKPARIALVFVATGDEASIARHVESWNSNKKTFEWKARGAAVASIDYAARPDLSWGEGAYHARIGWEAGGAAGGAAMVVDLLRFSKDASMPPHVHDKERECLAFLEGSGELSLTLGPADAKGNRNERSIPVEPGTVACIPDGMWHTWKPSGTTAMLAIQVYTPPGPEKWLQRLASRSR